MRTCVVYRTNARDLKADHDKSNYNEADEPQFEACEFSDGRVAQRWLTAYRSCVWWDSWSQMCAVHVYPHSEYVTRIEWSDGRVEHMPWIPT